MIEFDGTEDPHEIEAFAAFEKLQAEDLAEICDDGVDGFRLHLLIPIKAFPDKTEATSMHSQLRFRLTNIGDLMDSDKKPSDTAKALSLIAKLTGHDEKVLRQLNPKDFHNATVVAYIPLTGPRFLPTGSNG